MINRKIQIKIS